MAQFNPNQERFFAIPVGALIEADTLRPRLPTRLSLWVERIATIERL